MRGATAAKAEALVEAIPEPEPEMELGLGAGSDAEGPPSKDHVTIPLWLNTLKQPQMRKRKKKRSRHY